MAADKTTGSVRDPSMRVGLRSVSLVRSCSTRISDACNCVHRRCELRMDMSELRMDMRWVWIRNVDG